MEESLKAPTPGGPFLLKLSKKLDKYFVNTIVVSVYYMQSSLTPPLRSRQLRSSPSHTTAKSDIRLRIYQISLHTLLVKYYNDLLGRQSAERGMDEVTFFYVGDLFVYTLALSIPIFKKKISAEILDKIA